MEDILLKTQLKVGYSQKDSSYWQCGQMFLAKIPPLRPKFLKTPTFWSKIIPSSGKIPHLATLHIRYIYTNDLQLKMNCWTSKFGLVGQLLMVSLLSQPVQILSDNFFSSGNNFFENTSSHYKRLKNVSFWLHVHKGREKTS